MAKEFEGKAALVTGGSRGIGRAAAVRLAEGGCAIAIGYAGNEAAANEAKAACQSCLFDGSTSPLDFDSYG